MTSPTDPPTRRARPGFATEEEYAAAWEAAKPRPRRKDKHGRPDIVAHPFLLRAMARPRRVEPGP